MNRKPRVQAVGDGDAELRMRLLKRLDFLEEKVQRCDFYIKKVKEVLNEDSPFVSMVEIEKWISQIEQEMGCAGSVSLKDFEFGSSCGKTEEGTPDRKLGNVKLDWQDTLKNTKVRMEMDSSGSLNLRDTSLDVKHIDVIDLTTSETLDENVNQGNDETMVADEDVDKCSGNRLRQMGVKVATGGWFVSEGELALLAHDDGCCSLYDVTNGEEKCEFKPDVRLPLGIWRDCWILRVAGVDGCSGKYVVAASAGNTTSGFCSWEFYSKKVHSYHIEDALLSSRAHLTSLNYSRRHIEEALPSSRAHPTSSNFSRRHTEDVLPSSRAHTTSSINSRRHIEDVLPSSKAHPTSSNYSRRHIEDALPSSRAHPTSSNYSRQHITDVSAAVHAPANVIKWWYKPCGPLMVSTASSLQTVKVFDIRDGEQVMKFELQKPVSTMEYCSPLQWKDKEKVVLAESDKVSLWDVNSLSPRPVAIAATCNRMIKALHIGNRDAEMSKGVRKRVNQPDSVRNDGVFCTADYIAQLDFRHPSGVGIKIPISNFDTKSVFSYGDVVFLGGSHQASAGNRTPQVQQYSLRKLKPVTFSTYLMPESNTQYISDDISQVWGDSNFVMAVSNMGLSRFLSSDYSNSERGVVIGPHILYEPSFDFASSRILLVSRDRPAMWTYII